MGKKIVILNGSPRKSGNTAALAKAFAQGAEGAENTVTEFFLGGMEKKRVLQAFGAHIFFDDNEKNTREAAKVVLAVRVPGRSA